MQLSITYTLLHDSPTTVQITPAIWIKWERRFKTKISALATGGLGYEDLAFLCFEAHRAAGNPKPATFDLFIDVLQGIDTDGVDPNPTNPEASAA